MLRHLKFSSEKELLQGCLDGDRVAQRQLYDQYSGKFMAICLRYLKDRQLAEDILIQSFMKIFEKIGQFESKGSFEGWMKRIVVTQALMALRTEKQQVLHHSLEEASQILDATETITQMEAAEMLTLVQELPSGYRTVFNLFVIEGYSHTEIAQLLGITESTSKSQLNRARNVLKEKIASLQLQEKTTHG
ncbi:MAG: sigma-70 family RNA polymerase sigma factor [Bacteroidetes bacterium]|nr:sigma-70 family RNA polymerase sigma factor [Bacteroidota bacterium]